MIKYLAPLLSIFLVACNNSKKEYTYFGGKIINPKSNFVIVSDHNGPLDSIKLNKNNTFLGKLKNIKTGLYYFTHGTEHQYIFLSPNDSLLVRLNTWDFDESLVFSGVNADRNNALINTFLENENDERAFRKFYTLDYKDFIMKIDSLKNLKLQFFENFKNENEETSEEFLNILKIAVTYPVYRKIESYSIQNAQREKPQKLDSLNIFAYRRTIDLSLDSLMFFSPYHNMAINQIYNDAYLKGYKKSSDEFNNALLNNINENIKSEKLKNKLLRQFTIRHFYRKSSCKIDEKSFDTFFSLCSNEDYKKDIELLLKDATSAKKNDKLPTFSLIGANGAKNDIKELIANNNAVLYFRNTKHSSDDWVASRYNYLIKNNPNILFFVVNIDDEKEYIKKLDIKHQYYLPKSSTAHNFLQSRFSRMILVNKKGVIENGFGGLSSEKINKQIAKLQNQ